MAQYEVVINIMIEAGNIIQSLADDLNAVSGKLDIILSELPENLREFRQQIASENITLEELCLSATKCGWVLLEIAEIYTQAEKSAFNNAITMEQRAATQLRASPSIANKTQSVLFLSDLVLPDWLKTAVIKYEQSKLDSAEG